MTPPSTQPDPPEPFPEMGSFFGLELPEYDNCPQRDTRRTVLLNSGRNALEYILRSLPGVRRIHLPLYACHTLLQPLRRLGIPHTCYHIDSRLELETPPILGDGEHLLYIHYFGIKEQYLDRLVAQYGNRLIIDNSMALYSPARPGIPSFYSPRKYSGLPDGGIAVLDHPTLVLRERDTSAAHAGYLLDRIERGAAASAPACQQSEDRLAHAPMLRISRLTERLMRGIDYVHAQHRRRDNFTLLHKRLSAFNKLYIDPASVGTPSCYPLWTGLPELRNHLIDHGILIPLYWPELLDGTPSGSTEHKLAHNLLPLPIDQRYTRRDMERLAGIIEQYYEA